MSIRSVGWRSTLLAALLLAVSSCRESTGSEGSIPPIEEVEGIHVDLAPVGSEPPQAAFGARDFESVEEYLTTVIRNLETTWGDLFSDGGLQQPVVFAEIVEQGESFESCLGPVVHDTPNAYWCKTTVDNGVIYLPLTTMWNTWNGDILGTKPASVTGDFAAAIITAHEFGHDIVWEYKDQLGQRNGATYNAPTGKYFELIADCMAGVWAAKVWAQGNLEDGDFDEAVAALEAIGDAGLTSSQPHGTPAERAQALKDGFYGGEGREAGEPASCWAYWVTSS